MNSNSSQVQFNPKEISPSFAQSLKCIFRLWLSICVKRPRPQLVKWQFTIRENVIPKSLLRLLLKYWFLCVIVNYQVILESYWYKISYFSINLNLLIYHISKFITQVFIYPRPQVSVKFCYPNHRMTKIPNRMF